MGETGMLAALPINELVFFVNKGLLAGLIIGSIYALGAVGVTLIVGILRFSHFPHGDMMTAGAFFALMLTALFPGAGDPVGLPSAFVLMPIAMVVTAAMAIGLDRVFYRPLRTAGVKPIVIVMASIGVMLMMQGLIRLFAGTEARQIDSGAKSIYKFPVGGRDIVLTEPQLILILFTAAAVVALHLFLTRSRMGKAMRAMSDNPDLARISGIATETVVRTTWIIAGGLAAAGGTLLVARRVAEAGPLVQSPPADLRRRHRRRHRPTLRRHRRRPAGRLHRNAGRLQLVRSAAAAGTPSAGMGRAAGQTRLRADGVQDRRSVLHPDRGAHLAPDGYFQGEARQMTAYARRAALMTAGAALLVALVFAWLGAAYGMRMLVEASCFALIALGLTIQWGYAGLFNAGVMGFVATAAFVSMLVSYPVNDLFWNSDGPALLGKAGLALLVGVAATAAASQTHRLGLPARYRTLLTLVVGAAAYLAVQGALDPAATLVESEARFVGGLGLPVWLGWLAGGIAAGRPRLGGGPHHAGAARRLHGDRHAGHRRDREVLPEERRLADQGHAHRFAPAMAGADAQRTRLRPVARRLSQRHRGPHRGVLCSAGARLGRALGPHDAGHSRQ